MQRSGGSMIPLVLLLVSSMMTVNTCLATNSVNISTGGLELPSTCLSRLDSITRSSASVASAATQLLPASVEVDVANSIGSVTFTTFACSKPPPLQATTVTWRSVVPTGWSAPAGFSSNTTWVQPWYYPPSNTGRFGAGRGDDDINGDREEMFHNDVTNCLLTCVNRYPSSLSLVLYLSYGNCYCTTTLPSMLNTSTDCCAPLLNSTPSSISDIPAQPSTCDAGAMYGQLLRVNVLCPINASTCTTAATQSTTGSSTSCTIVSGCCSSNSASGNGDNTSSAESTAAKWLVGLLLVAVACQLAYWVIKLRMCGRRGDRRQRPVEVIGDAAILRHNAARRHSTRRVARVGGHEIVVDNDDEEMGDGGDMLAQLNEIARRMRIAFIRQQQQRAEPKRSKDEALDAALEALELFPPCPPDGLDPEESCCMCLDALSDRDCVRVLCGHVIHRECMREFLAHKLVSYRAPVTCPMCRATVLIQNSAPTDDPAHQQPNALVDDSPPHRRVGRQESTAAVLSGGDGGTLDAPLIPQDDNLLPLPPPSPPRERRSRGHSRGRRFRVVMANLAVEHILERRHDDESDRSVSFESASVAQPYQPEPGLVSHDSVPYVPPAADTTSGDTSVAPADISTISAEQIPPRPFTLHDL